MSDQSDRLSKKEAKEKIEVLRMSTGEAKEKIKQLEAEQEAVRRRQQQLVKQMASGSRKSQALIEHSDREIEKAQQEPDPERRQRVVRLAELRKQAAISNMELLEMVSSLDLAKKITPQFQASVDLMVLRGQYLATEYSRANYGPIEAALVKALEGGPGPGTAPLPAAAAARGPQPTAPGPQAQRPDLRQGLPPRPEAPGVRPGLPGARPGMPSPAARPGAAVGTGPVAPGTGPLSQRAAAPRPVPGPARSITGPLQAGGASGRLPQPADKDLTLVLRDAAASSPELKTKLQELLSRLQDLDSSLHSLRGEETGTLAIPLENASPAIRQCLGKVYYINRVISTLGPLGERIPFTGEPPDPSVAKLLMAIEEAAEAAPVPDAPAAAPAQPSLSSMLKSLFRT